MSSEINTSKTAAQASKMRFVFLGMFAALSIVLVTLVHIPILPAAPFLEYDPADVPILIGTFAYGPVWGLVLTAVVCIVQGLTVSAASGWWGILMHFLATGGMVLVAGLIYRGNRTRKGAVAGLIAGALTMIVLMIPLNILIDPLYLGASKELVIGMLLPAIIPFNAIKSVLNCLITFFVYKAVSRLINKVS